MAEQKLNTKQLPKKLVQLTLPEVLPFNNVISTLTITSVELERTISDLFGSVFEDFEGSKIFDARLNGKETLKCTLYFKPCTNKGDGIYALKVRGENNPAQNNPYSLSEMVKTINMNAKSKLFELEDIAKEILSEFIFVQDVKVEKRYNEEIDRVVDIRLPKNWNVFVSEVSDTPVPNNKLYTNQYLGVTVDLLPIIWKLFGRKDPEEVKELAKRNIIPKNRYDYQVNIVKLINPTMKSYVLEIRKIDINELNKLASSIGYGNVTGNIIMTRR